MTLDTNEKLITLRWRDDSGAWAEQPIALAYYPTRAIFLGDGRVCVAGKRKSGATTVDLMKINPPTRKVNAVTGEVSLVVRRVGYVDTIFDEAVIGKDMVRLITKNKADTNQVFVQFWDSMDLYSLDLTTGAHFLAASPTAQAGVLHAPGLARGYLGVTKTDHITQGHLYTLSGHTDSAPTLVLVDSDRDGMIDAQFELTAQQWADLGYQDASNYNW